MTIIKIKPNGTEIVTTTERGKEKEKVPTKQERENIIIRMIGIIIMDIKRWTTGDKKSLEDIEIQNRVDQWRKEVSRRKK